MCDKGQCHSAVRRLHGPGDVLICRIPLQRSYSSRRRSYGDDVDVTLVNCMQLFTKEEELDGDERPVSFRRARELQITHYNTILFEIATVETCSEEHDFAGFVSLVTVSLEDGSI